MTATKDHFFKPEKLSADASAVLFNATVRTILDAESAARSKKTQALRALRLSRPTAELPLPARKRSAPRRKAA